MCMHAHALARDQRRDQFSHVEPPLGSWSRGSTTCQKWVYNPTWDLEGQTWLYLPSPGA